MLTFHYLLHFCNEYELYFKFKVHILLASVSDKPGFAELTSSESFGNILWVFFYKDTHVIYTKGQIYFLL